MEKDNPYFTSQIENGKEYEMDISVLKGKTLKSIDVDNDKSEIIFTTDNGRHYKMNHRQDCCEDVTIDEIIGDLNNLIGTPILSAREDTNSKDNPKEENDTSHTWTFYNLATTKGYVTIRWYGTSNGYYSEGVDFYEYVPNKDYILNTCPEYMKKFYTEMLFKYLVKYSNNSANITEFTIDTENTDAVIKWYMDNAEYINTIPIEDFERNMGLIYDMYKHNEPFYSFREWLNMENRSWK